MNAVSSRLIKWYEANKRELPWRDIKDPYRIWLSEIILQQTRVAQGLSYFNKILDRFPTVHDMAAAHEDEILKLWQGLGYYTRARNMHLTAQQIINTFSGKFPQEYDLLLNLAGIGKYTAAAIASFAFDQPHAVVDGNVNRFLSRYYGIKEPVDTIQGRKKIDAFAQKILNKKLPAIHNQAIMEFGALQCTPKPDCKRCIFISDCKAFLRNKQDRFPAKSKKQKIKFRFFNYLFIKWNDKIFIQKRTAADIWRNLYHFPLIESQEKISQKKLLQNPELKELLGKGKINLHYLNEYRCRLTHQLIQVKFYKIQLKKKPSEYFLNTALAVALNDLDSYGMPRIIQRFIESQGLIAGLEIAEI